MNTITFYSYKGGVGRTLALANVARYLALLGKRVVCADFDFEAPGLHYKFGVLKEDIAGGTIDIIEQFLTHGRLDNRIEELAVQVDVGDIRGSVHLLAAGRAPDPDYWKTLGKIDWHRLFFEDREDGTPQGIDLFLAIQAQIQDVLEPDYLLIDARTGITEVGGVALSLLANAVVCVLAHNRENLDGARAVLRSVQAAPRLSATHAIRLLPVLSRIPTKLEPGEEEELVESVQDFLNKPAENEAGNLSVERVFVLHSEPRLQVYEALKVPEAGAVEESTLLRDYLELFRDLIPREDVVGGFEPLLARARERAFEDPDAAQGELESLALLYPARETGLALLQLYILRNLSPDRLLQAAQRLYDVSQDPTEPTLLSVIKQHIRIASMDSNALHMAVDVWEAQVPENGELAAALVKEIKDLALLSRILDISRRQGKQPVLIVALIYAYIDCGEAQAVAALADQFMPTSGKDGSFLEARVAAVVALGDEERAAALADELEPMRERLPKAKWSRLLIAAGRLTGPSPDVMRRTDQLLEKVQANPTPARFFLDAAQNLVLELSETDSTHLLFDAMRLMKSRGARRLLSLLDDD
jgi:MinD-like ATPase involved in chromosome partitioning or flagellar assembly